MAVNDEIYKNLAQYGGGTINERVYNYLGSLGYTGTINDRLAQYSSEGRKGWQGLIRAFGGLGWTPAALFAQDQQGDGPKPKYLFQDAAGTVLVTADGDPVGYMQDLSGNGNHATQSTSADRPLYQTDGSLHWLQFDGAGDSLDTGVVNVVPAPVDGVDLSIHILLSLDSGDRQVILGNRGQISSGWTLRIQDGAARYEHPGAWGVTSAPLPIDQGFHVLSVLVTDRVYFRVDGQPLSDHARGTGYVASSNTTAISSPDNQGAMYSGSIGALVLREGDTGHQQPDIEQYLANLAGITL
jgi:hypothetical protein